MVLKFHSEKPAEKDAFPGESHHRIAKAMVQVVEEKDEIRIIGLDGDFGSGKSSILNMFSILLTQKNSSYKTWTFDCEQNYQGSIKSNFLELFSAEILDHTKDIPSKKEAIEEIRDISLGKRLDYTKNTKSRVSAWAIVFFIAVLFSSSAMREFVNIVSGTSKLSWPPCLIILLVSLSPAIVLICAQIWNKFYQDSKFTLWGIIKGNSVDEIKERIDIGKDVSTVELKKSIDKILEHAPDIKYIIIIDNLDRLPKQDLRAVWSDLEIFTSAANEGSFKIIVPFSSEKVAIHLSELSAGDGEESVYDARDFISKKFPVVFRTPPIITSGWKSYFTKIWIDAFGADSKGEANLCSTLIHRHVPNPQKGITPRFQKRFFNDLQTTLLTSPPDVNRLAVSAYILVCRYNGIPIQRFLSNHPNARIGESDNQNHEGRAQEIENEVQLTRSLLTRHFGSDLDTGWPSTVLQVHYQTTHEIAISELIETPIQAAIESGSGEQLGALINTFGFDDAFRKVLTNPALSIVPIVKSLAAAIEKIGDNEKTQQLIELFNNHYDKSFVNEDLSSEDDVFFKSLAELTKSGMHTRPFEKVVDAAHSTAQDIADISAEKINTTTIAPFARYDNYLNSLALDPENIIAYAGDVFVTLIVPYKDFKVIGPEGFRFNSAGYADAIKNLISNEEVTFDKTPVELEVFNLAIPALLGARRLGGDGPYKNETFYTNKTDTSLFLTALKREESDPRIWLGLLLSTSIENTSFPAIALSAASTTDTQCKAIAIVTMVRNNYQSGIDDIPGALEALEENEDLAYTLFKATCTYKQLFNLLTTKLNLFAAKFLVRAIKADDVEKISFRDTLERFDLFCYNTQALELRPADALGLLETYSHLYPKNLFPIKGLSGEFVETALLLSDTSKAGSAIIEHYADSELTSEEWKATLLDSDRNIDIIANHFKKKEIKPSKAATLRDSIIQILGDLTLIVNGNSFFFDRCLNLSDVLNQKVMPNFSSDLRRLSLSLDLPPPYRSKLIDRFGGYISVFVPESLSEYEALGKLIELVLHGEASGETATFIEKHAKAIGKYSIPDEYLVLMAHQANELQRSLPKLYSEFRGKKPFKNEIARINRARRAAEKLEKRKLTHDEESVKSASSGDPDPNKQNDGAE